MGLNLHADALQHIRLVPCIPGFLHLWIQPTAGLTFPPCLIESMEPVAPEAVCPRPFYQRTSSPRGRWDTGPPEATPAHPLLDTERQLSFHHQLILLVRLCNMWKESEMSF